MSLDLIQLKSLKADQLIALMYLNKAVEIFSDVPLYNKMNTI